MVSSVQGTSSGSSQQTTSKMSSIRPEEFLQIMVKELQQQDPFEPVSSKDMVTQMAQVRDIQSSMDLSTVLKDLSLSQKLSSASVLLGKTITGKNTDGKDAAGVVTSVKREGDKVYLELDSGERVSVDDVMTVNNPTQASTNQTNS